MENNDGGIIKHSQLVRKTLAEFCEAEAPASVITLNQHGIFQGRFHSLKEYEVCIELFQPLQAEAFSPHTL